jgi:predicted ATP-grasp superfamily ATP-dependent carboligase
MSNARVTTTTTIQVPNTVTVGELQSLLEGIPPTGTVRFDHFAGDQRDPSYTTITVTHRPDNRR